MDKNKKRKYGITDKEEAYVQELLKGCTQREAYIVAYPGSNKWTDNAIDVRACRVFAKPNVLKRYEQLHNVLIKEAEDECIVSAKDVLRELKRIGFADIKDFLTFKTNISVVGVDNATGAPIVDYKQVVQLLDSDDVDGHAISELHVSDNGTLKFKLHDKMQALDRLGKHLGMFTDSVEVTGKGGEALNVVFNIPRPAENN